MGTEIARVSGLLIGMLAVLISEIRCMKLSRLWLTIIHIYWASVNPTINKFMILRMSSWKNMISYSAKLLTMIIWK